MIAVLFRNLTCSTTLSGMLCSSCRFSATRPLIFTASPSLKPAAICEQDIDLWEADDDMEYADLIKAAGNAVAAAAPKEAIEGEITELQARMIALADSGFKADEVTFTKCRRDQDDGVWQYEIELKLADGTEYDYELKAADGTIMDKDVDND